MAPYLRRQDGSMVESGKSKGCPYCEGKGDVSVLADLPGKSDCSEELSKATWARRRCPLCDGKGHICSAPR